jgi:hypothetical protein
MGPRYAVSQAQRSSKAWSTSTLPDFSPYYRQDDPRTAGAMDMYFRDALQLEKYADIINKDLHAGVSSRWG